MYIIIRLDHSFRVDGYYEDRLSLIDSSNQFHSISRNNPHRLKNNM